MTQLDLFPIAKSSQQDTPVNPSVNRKGAEDDRHIWAVHYANCYMQKTPLVRFRKCWWSHLIGSRQGVI